MRGTQFAQLTAFAAVAEHRSFTRAANHLGISTPSVSEAVRSLEDRFQLRLFNRTTRSVALTEAGQQLLDSLNPAFENIERAIDAMNGLRCKPTGVIRLSVHPIAANYVLGPLLSNFSSIYPEIGLDISAGIVEKSVLCEKFDAGVHLERDISEGMIATPIGGIDNLVTVASPNYLKGNSHLTRPQELSGHNCVRCRLSEKEAVNCWVFESAENTIEVEIQGSVVVNSVGLALQAALAGVGIAQLPEASASIPLCEGKLVRVLTNWSTPAGRFLFSYATRKHVPLKLRVLIDFMRKQRCLSNNPPNEQPTSNKEIASRGTYETGIAVETAAAALA